MGTTEDLVANVVETDFAALPRDAVSRAKWRVIDNLGCLIAGAHAAGCQGVVNLVRRWGGAEESTVLVHGIKAPAHNVAMVNSLMTRSFDFEPVEADGPDKSSPAHISGTTVPTAVTMAEQVGASGKDLITALVIGDDLAARLGVASGFDFGLGWDNTGTLNGFGAAAIACKLLKHDARKVSHAFGIALNQIGGSLDGVWDKAMTFKLCMSLASRTGIFSAELAEQGFTGVKDAFCGKYGYFKLYCSSYDTSNLTKDLGRKFYADRVIKPYSSCRATHSAIDSALQISRGNDIRADRVNGIVIKLAPWIIDGFTGELFEPGDTPQIDGAFSIRFTVATALLRKGVKPAFFSDACIGDPEIQKLIGKMKLVPAALGHPLASEIELTMRDGSVLSGATEFPSGDIFRTPLSDDQIRAKFRENVAYSRTIPERKAEQALSMLEELENVADVREVVGLLS